MVSDVLSTYRVQLRRPESGFSFTFADAEGLLDYVAELGVSHLYLSPILTAVVGSTHGYDVTDPTTVDPALGGADGLARLAAAAATRGLGLIVDIVPNHVGVARPEQNRWWFDLLRHGRASRYADFFDVDWELGAGRIILPLLGSDADLDDLTVCRETLRLGELILPIAPGTGGGTSAEVHDRQHYRLVDWRSGACGYRRFFSISSLAALRQEDPAVFAASHTEVARWFRTGLVHGVRVDHPDGLADPVGYLHRLRELTGPDAWIVIEKILAADEALEPTLPVAGSTGYDALRLIGGVFLDPRGAPALTALAGPPPDPVAMKEAAVTETLGAELHRLARAIAAGTGTADPLLGRALTALVARVGVYRCDYPGLAAVLPAALAAAEEAAPDLASALALITVAIDTDPTTAARLQQLCGAATAKAVEDCLFYRDARLVAGNEVGADPRRFAVGAAEFHHANAVRGRDWPAAMVTLSTHDTKRGEDVRARIGVLSQLPGRWAEVVARWEQAAPSPDAATGLFLWQNIVGVWPADGVVTDALRSRLHAYAGKAVREAGLHTCWLDPVREFEAALHDWLDTVLAGPVAVELTGFVAELAPHAEAAALGQKLLALTVPGVPDIYQGSELFDDSLVDPDNRRPVDYPLRRAELAALTHPKLRVTATALRLRGRRPETFRRGGYRPLPATGSAAEHVVAFHRGTEAITAVSRWTVRLAETGWGDTTLTLPDGGWTELLTGRRWAGGAPVPAAELFAGLPVALLERADG